MIDFRKRVYSILGQNNNLKKIGIVKHFLQEDFKGSTLFNIIKRHEIGLPIEDLPRTGCPTSFHRKNLKRLQHAAENRVGIIQRKLSRKFEVAQSTIHYNMRKLGLKYFKQQKAPKYTKKNNSNKYQKNVENCNVKL
jgi:hypothetical protein